ncbi:alcohol dehydrogenase catalytic domain-containing protein, partial [Acinetobacter baumannii]|uniref:alcohol dehydrogenase catalytic domain-containing protein n=1 Tax=Acinetobacter baumannii TaxID=470 RepID=UPI001D170F9E
MTIKILYCGICHSDLHAARNDWGNTVYPIVPGHEITGIVTAVGSNVKGFKVGDPAGVGCLVGACHSCELCQDNLENYCSKLVFTYNGVDKDGSITYGGYSDFIVVHNRYAVQFPEKLPLDGGAPLLCAGITVYSPMKYYGMTEPGKRLGVVGLGGLGHMAVKFGKAFGLKVTVISTSPNKEKEAKESLG